MGMARFTRHRASDDQREIQARKATISRLQRLTDTASVDYGTPSGRDDKALGQRPRIGAPKRSSAQEAGA